MARRVPSYILADRAAKAKKREDYYATRNLNPDTQNSIVVDLPRIQVGYRSLLLKTGATPAPALLQLTASKSAINFFEGLGVDVDPTNAAAKLGLVYTGLEEYIPITNFSATKIKAVLGGTKQATFTPWGTRVVKYTKNAAGTARNSYTAPMSIKTGTLDVAGLRTAAGTIRTAIETSLGDNGRLWLEPERENYQIAEA